MISIRPSHIVSATATNESSRPKTTAGSVTSQVIEFFHKRLKNIQTFPASAQSSDGLAPAHKRIEQLLRFAVTKEYPSVAERISQLIKSSHEPLTDTALRNQVEQHLNQPSALDAQKTYAQLLQEILDSSASHTSNTRPAPLRLRRDLQAPEPASATRNAAVRQFTDALIDSGDRQLAIGVANSLMRQRLAVEKGHSSDAEDKVIIPADSTFGQAWAELADALYSEPFKSFAEARKIDVSGLTINSRGQLTEMRDNVPVNLYLHRDADWAAASAQVMSAARKVLAGKQGVVMFRDREHASAYNIASFYGLQLGGIRSDDTLFSIGQLLREGTFPAFSSTDPHYATVYAPVKQRQNEASQRLMNLPPDQLMQRLDRFTSSTAARKVQDADRTLAQQCSQAVMRLAPQARVEGEAFPPVLKEIPEYSTFNQVRKNLLDALTGSAFTTFAQEHNVEPGSVRIHPVTGELTGKVNGKDTPFVPNDLSGWGVVWAEIADAVRQMAAGAEQPVRYPSPPSASLYEVMSFYNEEIPRQQNGQQANWRQRALISLLDRSTEMTRNNGFKALIDPSTGDNSSKGVRERQYAIRQQCADTPASLSKLETLAAAVEPSSSATVGGARSPQDALASAESALAAATHRAMREVKNNPTQASMKMIGPIPAASLFGQWRSYLDKAIKARGFIEWAEKHKVDLTSLRFDPNREALIGKVNGVDQRFSAADFAKNYPEHFDVLAPVLNAARVFATPGRPITLSDASTTNAPLEWVGRFYGITTHPRSQAFERSMTQLESMKKFPRNPDHPEQMVNWLNQQKTALGDSNDRYALISQLKHGNIDNDDTTRFIVDPGSSHRPKGVTTVQKFLTDQGWYEAKSAAQVDNLLQALQTPLPQAPTLGNNCGFLASALPLSKAQREAVSTFVKQAISPHPNLLSHLSAQVPKLSSSPAQALDQLLSSDSALELATNLQTEMKGAVTSTSLKQWLLTALVLELDPEAGTSRNSLAGFDLMHKDNWGLGTDKIRELFNNHLTTNRKIPANLAPVAAHLLMTGAAPHLLVNDVPSTVTLGSTDWVSFMTAVNRIELNAPGAASGMTFGQVMNLHRISPISERESQLHSVAQMNPVLDWAIVNGHIVRNDKDEYTLEQLASSQEKLKKQNDDISSARHYLSNFNPPSRREMALSELREKWGTDTHYERPYLTEMVGPFGMFSNTRASIVDVYEAGRLGESWRWESTRGPDFDALRARASELPDINAKFNQAFEEDFALRRTHTISLFKNMFSQLPLADRDIVNNGSATILQVKGTGSGILMQFTHKEQSRTFAIYPAYGKIVPVPNIEQRAPYGQTTEETVDTAAFKTNAEPKPDIKSKVLITRLDQNSLVDPDHFAHGRRPLYAENDKTDLSSYDGTRIQHLAEVLVDSVYLNKAAALATQRGLNNAVENGLELSDYFQKGLRFLPGGSSLVDIYHGEYAEAVKDLGVDIAIYVFTEGVGKLCNVAKSGAAWAAAKAAAKFVERFGIEETESIVLQDLTTTGAEKAFSSVSQMQGGQYTKPIGEAFVPTADMVDGTVRNGDTSALVKLTAIFQDGEWYAYNPKTMAADGPALKGFVPESNQRNVNGLFDFFSNAEPDPDMPARFEMNVVNSQLRDEQAFKAGYNSLKPETIPGYRSDMGKDRIRQLIADTPLSAEQVGSLVRQRERLIIADSRINIETFNREVEGAGGTSRGMSQGYYLALTQPGSDGECAALSNTMALALSEGTENTLIDNVHMAMANPKSAGGSKFISELSALQANVDRQSTFQTGTSGVLMPYKDIGTTLGNAETSKTLLIGAKDHGMLAGVRVDPADASKKSWFYYDPNYGLATFNSETSMKAGLEKTLNSGKVGKGLNHFGNAFTGPKYNVGVFDINAMAQRRFDIARVRDLTRPISLDTTQAVTDALYGRIRLGGPMETVRPLDGEIQTFVDTYDGKPRLNIIGHAPEPENPGDPIKIVGDNDARYSAAEVNQKLLDRGVDIRDYANVRTLTCFSASGGTGSFAGELNKLTGVPVKGFEGPVTTEWMAGTDLNEQYQLLLKRARTKYPKFKQEDIEWIAENDLNKIYHNKFRVFTVRKDVGTLVEANMGTTKKPVYVTLPVDYRPVRFGPAKAPKESVTL